MQAVLDLKNQMGLAYRRVLCVIGKSKSDLTIGAKIIGAIHTTVDRRSQVGHHLVKAP